MSGHKKISLNKGDPHDQIHTQKNISTVKHPPSLLDLSAQATAKYCCSSDLDVHIYGLDETLMRKVLSQAFPQDIQQIQVFADLTDRQESWKRALKLYQENGVKEMYQIGFMYVAYLAKFTQGYSESKVQGTTLTTKFESWQPRHGDVRVSLLVEKQKIIKTTCSECTGIWCEHVFAAIIYRMKQPEKITMHAPMTESLSSLSRDQLQKLLQYAADEDPAGVLGRVFKFYNEVRDSDSKMNEVYGAPDPTFRGLQGGDQSQWSQSLDVLSSRISADLNNMTENREFYAFTQNRTFARYPDNYDITMKMESKFFSYINFVREFTKQGEFLSAAEIMQKLIINTAEKIRDATRSDCPSLSRWWHDLSHIHALLVLRTEDKEARSVLMSTALHINATEAMKEHILQTSDWSELPSLTQLFSHDAEKSILANCLCLDVVAQLSTEGCMMIESVLANQLQPNPRDLCRLLDGTDNCDNTSYNEDLIVMLARLESLFYFDKDQQKITRLGLIILQKLSVQVQQYSILGQFVGSSSDKSDSGAPSSLIKLFCPGPPATSTKQEPNPQVSTSVDQMETESLPQQLRGFTWNCTNLAHAMLYTLHIVIESQKVSALDSISRKVLVGFCLQALELSRHRMQAVVGPSKPNLHVHFDEDEFSFTQSKSSISLNQSERQLIRQIEHDWCVKLETAVCNFLGLVSDEECHGYVSIYLRRLYSAGTSIYSSTCKQNNSLNIGGEYPLVLLETICRLFLRNTKLKKSAVKRQQMTGLCSNILLSSTSSQVFNTLFDEKLFQNLLHNHKRHINKYMDVKDFQAVIDKFRKRAEVGTFQVAIETLKFLQARYKEESDIVLFNKILKHLENIRTVALLKLIAKIVQHTRVWRFADEQQVIKRVLNATMKTYKGALGLADFGPPFYASKESTYDPAFGSSPDVNVEKNLILYLIKKMDLSAILIFSDVWKYIFTCEDLQDFMVFLQWENKGGSHPSKAWTSLNPAILSMFDDFYDSKLSHDEDACTLLTRYFTTGSDLYERIFGHILDNSENCHPEILFYLAKLELHLNSNINQSTLRNSISPQLTSGAQTSNDLSNPKDAHISIVVFPMNQKTFDIVEKAFEKLDTTTVSNSILEALDWVFDSCIVLETKEQIKVCTRLEFYDKLVWCVCHHAKSQPLIVIKILQCIESKCGGIASGFLSRHKSISELFSALFVAYREYFVNRLKAAGDYGEVIQEMIETREKCKNVHNGDREFDKEVVKPIKARYFLDKKLVGMLGNAFPSESEFNGNGFYGQF